MNKIIISNSSYTINRFYKLMAKRAHLYTLSEAATTEEFLMRDDIKRFDVILIAGNDKLQAVETIKAKLPKANIILINDQEEVIEEADVIDIVTAPVSEAKFLEVFKEAEVLINRNPSENVIITGFKSLSFKNNLSSEAPINVNWRTAKAKELFAYLLVNCNEFQSKRTIGNMFWSDLSEKSVTQQLYSTIYEIRKTIENYHIPVEIINSEDTYMLVKENAWIDFQVFEQQLNTITEVTEKNYQQVEDILNLYTGHLFEQEGYEWAINKKEKLKFLWIIYMEKLSDFYVERGQIHEAIMHNLRLRQNLPNNTLVKENLNKLYEMIGEPGIE